MSKRESEIEEVPEDEEMDFDEDEEMDEGVDLLDALSQMFTTEDGETVASALVGMKNAIEMQNKILIKILSTLSKPAATA
jgi:Cdc6-like AAA superfamily ATPase